MDVYEQVRAMAQEEETMLRAYRHGTKPRGFWPIPWRQGLWTASLLVDKAEREDGNTEYGGMSYVLGELFHALDGRILGEYYPYSDKGGHDHEHDFLTVLCRAILSGEVEPEQPKEYYAPWMAELLEKVRTQPDLRRKARRWAADPWRCAKKTSNGDDIAQALRDVCPELAPPQYALTVDGVRQAVAEIEQVYAYAALFPNTLHYCPEQYSEQQIENIEAILAYQRAALAGEAP